MILRKLMPYIQDETWIDITEQTDGYYKNHIGKVPKILITGPVLSYDVLEVKDPIEARGITFQRILVKWRGKK